MAQRKKLECKYGSQCYRKNAQHLRDYNHPRDSEKDKPSVTTSRDTKVKVNDKRKRANGGQQTLEETLGKHFEGNDHSVSNSDEDIEEEPQIKKTKTKKICTDAKQSHLDPENSDDDLDSATSEGKVNGDNKDETEGDCDPPSSPEDVKENIKAKYLVEMPEDFYHFWEFCKSINSAKPQDALKDSLNLRLRGPFDILSGRHKRVTRNKKGRRPNFFLHFRFYYDPPEFQTVFVADDMNESQFHMGYYRDDPRDLPVFVASNCPTESPREKISPCGDNLFAAVRLYAQKMVPRSSGSRKTSIQSLVQKLGTEAERLGLSVEANSKSMKSRQKKVVCPTFHGAGLVVPVDGNDVGYRPVPESPGDLRKMFRRISEAKTPEERDTQEEGLQELITLVQFANDEADYGEGLELGMDLFSFGGKVFHPHISTLLPLAYQLLNRPQFSTIIQAHLEERRKDEVDELE